jgi:hypothetical protein
VTAPAFRSKGTSGSGTTSCTAAVPTGGSAPQANDILLIVVESSDSTTAAGTPNTPAGGWSKLFEETQGGGATNVVTLTVFGKRAGGSETDVTIDGVGNHVAATMLVFSGCVTTGDAWTVGTGNGGTAASATVTGLNTPSAENLVVMIVGVTRDANSTTTFANWANSNLTSILEREDNTTSSGAGGGIGVATGEKATAGATGDSTVDMTATTHVWRSVHIALAPPADSSLTVNKSDSISATEAKEVVILIGASRSDAVTVAESGTTAIVTDVNKSDSVSTAEAVTASVVSQVNKSDSVAVAESATTLISTAEIRPSDNVGVSENWSQEIQTLIAKSESVTVAESASVSILEIATLEVAKSDSITVTDQASAAPSLSQVNISDAVNLAENKTVTISDPQVNKSDAVTVAESASLTLDNLQIIAVENVALSELFGLSVSDLQISTSDGISLSEITSLILPQASHSVSVSDAIAVTEGSVFSVHSVSTGLSGYRLPWYGPYWTRGSRYGSLTTLSNLENDPDYLTTKGK